VVEFGPEKDAGKVAWESEMLPGGPMGIHRLENGNTVVACTDANIVVELDTRGKIAKKWTIDGRPVDVQRLENGNTLVTLQNGQKVVEVDGEGKTIWSTKVAMINPFSAQRLENGNTLVAVLSQQKVVEINAAGDKEVWTLGGLMNPYHARRLTNGNTLIVDQNGVYEYETETKKQVWKLAVPNVSRASRF
jgi:outer membrane protein assembly factor BamB